MGNSSNNDDNSFTYNDWDKVKPITKAEQLHKHTKPKLRQRKCKFCHSYFPPDRKGQETCSVQCAVDYLPVKMAKKKRKGIKQFRDTDKAVLIKKAQVVFNRFIRYRDEGNPCYTCGHTGSRQVHASHYRPTGRNSKHRFNEMNVHGACSICNQHLSGNLIPYREALIRDYGVELIDELEKDNEPKRWSIDELKEVIDKYSKKLKG